MSDLDEVENSQSTTQARGDVCQTPDEAHVDNLPGAASSILSLYPLISASNYLTVLPAETECDSKTQVVVHGSVDAVTGQNWKLRDDGSVAAKSRSVLVGWKDPTIYQLVRTAPTPTQQGIMEPLQWLASAKVTGRIADLTNAFGQASKTSRKTNLPQNCHRE